MLKTEWFRRSTWTATDRQDFHARLNRSRTAASKAQYLRIQACHLAEAGYHLPAIELLDLLLDKFPQRTELAQAFGQKAPSLASLGKIDAAVEQFIAALDAERRFPNVKTNAWLEFSLFVAENELSDLYDEIIKVLEEFATPDSLTFPILEYQYWAARSIIANFRDDTEACIFAQRALDAASKEHSGFRYHPKLGLVTRESSQLTERLIKIATP